MSDQPPAFALRCVRARFANSPGCGMMIRAACSFAMIAASSAQGTTFASTFTDDPPAATSPAPPTAPASAPASAPLATPPKKNPPSLDDLLGIPSPKPTDKSPASKDSAPSKPADADKPAGEAVGDPKDAAKGELDRLLSAQEMGDAFRQAVTLMGDASRRLGDTSDPGLDTQRVQEDVLKRLDQLIASLKKNQSQSSSSSSSSSQQQQKSQEQNPQQQKRPTSGSTSSSKPTGERTDQGPARADGPLKPALESAKAAWGTLPPRVREMLMQGSNDRFSARYKALTEEYYKRLAEEGK